MQRPVLVTGFGAFREVVDNPTAHIAHAVDGTVVNGAMVVGHVLPVTYAGGPALAVRLAKALDAQLVIGLGVAGKRTEISVERVGKRILGQVPDTSGQAPADMGSGPDEVPATVDPVQLAALLGASVSEDAGGYVCNAWAWRVPQDLAAPAIFVHVPPSGMDPAALIAAIAALTAQTIA